MSIAGSVASFAPPLGAANPTAPRGRMRDQWRCPREGSAGAFDRQRKRCVPHRRRPRNDRADDGRDGGRIGYRDHERSKPASPARDSRSGDSGLTCDPSVGSSCMSDRPPRERVVLPTKQGRPRPVNPLDGLGPSATERSFGRTRRSARTVLDPLRPFGGPHHEAHTVRVPTCVRRVILGPVRHAS
jgi:hypothetical protein